MWQVSKNGHKSHFGTISVKSSEGCDHKLLKDFNERPDDVLQRFDFSHFSYHCF